MSNIRWYNAEEAAEAGIPFPGEKLPTSLIILSLKCPALEGDGSVLHVSTDLDGTEDIAELKMILENLMSGMYRYLDEKAVLKEIN